jgi:hypothetical protein
MFNNAMRTDHNVICEFCGGIDNSGRMDLWHDKNIPENYARILIADTKKAGFPRLSRYFFFAALIAALTLALSLSL